jgi:hypothetical protein
MGGEKPNTKVGLQEGIPLAKPWMVAANYKQHMVDLL